MPITWKNVSGSSGAGNAAVGAKLFEQSRDAMGDAFAGFEDILQNNRDAERAAWLQGKDNNTQAFLNQMSQYKTAEDFEAAKAAGQLPDFAQYGAQIDQSKAREFSDNRLGILQNAALDTQKYADVKTDVSQRPLREQYNNLIASKQYDAAAKFRAENDLGLEFEGAAQGQEETRANNLFDQGMKTKEFGLRQQEVSSRLRNDQIQYENLLQTQTDARTARLVDQQVGDFNKWATERDSQLSNGLNKLAVEMELPVDPTTGEPDFSKLDPGKNPEHRQLILDYKAEAEKRGLTDFNRVDATRQFVQAIGGQYGQKVADVAVKGISKDVPMYEDMSPQEKAFVDKERNKVTTKFADDQALIDRKLKANPLGATDPNAFNDSEKLIELVNKAAVDPGERTALMDQILILRTNTDPDVLALAVKMVSVKDEAGNWHPDDNRDDQLVQAVEDISKSKDLQAQVADAKVIRELRTKLAEEKLQEQALLANADKNATNALGYRTDNTSSTLGKLQNIAESVGNMKDEDEMAQQQVLINQLKMIQQHSARNKAQRAARDI